MKIEERPDLNEISFANQTAMVSLMPTAGQIPRLCTILQKGCHVRVRLGCTLRELLCDQFGISPEYLKYEIKVYFINYSPVDDIDKAVVRNGAIVALSAAMPGLVGAAMRQGELSWMRTGITYHDEAVDQTEDLGVIQVKLFNQVMADLGETFLRRGVYVKASSLADFLGRFPEDFQNGFNGIKINEEVIAEDNLRQFLSTCGGWVRLSIQ